MRLGENYINTLIDCDKSKVCAPPPQDIKIKKFILQDKYCSHTLINDYAIIELKNAVEFNGRLHSNFNILNFCFILQYNLYFFLFIYLKQNFNKGGI